jgi:hypothetical protein
VGSIFQQPPSNVSRSVFGAFDGSAEALDPAAIRLLYSHFDKFAPSGYPNPTGFPYTALRNYEAQQVAAGNHPIFVTATYAGKSRPVLCSCSLALQNGVPTAPSSNETPYCARALA